VQQIGAILFCSGTLPPSMEPSVATSQKIYCATYAHLAHCTARAVLPVQERTTKKDLLRRSWTYLQWKQHVAPCRTPLSRTWTCTVMWSPSQCLLTAASSQPSSVSKCVLSYAGDVHGKLLYQVYVWTSFMAHETGHALNTLRTRCILLQELRCTCLHIHPKACMLQQHIRK
jgi:hypothetical protein